MANANDKTDALVALIRKMAAHVRPTCSALYYEAIEALAAQPAPPAASVDVEELRRALCVIGVVGSIDGHDVIWRSSMLDIIDRRRSALIDSAGGAKGITGSVSPQMRDASACTPQVAEGDGAVSFDRSRETSRRQTAVEQLLLLGWTWSNGQWSRPTAATAQVPFRNMKDGATFEDYRDQLAVGNLTPVDQMAFDNLLHDVLAAAPKVGGVDYTPGRLDREAPPRVWLQIDTTGDNDDRDEPWPGPEHVTWQDESIGGVEIQYVRADLATPRAEQGGQEVGS